MPREHYRRVGDSETRRFLGRFVFSTNKDLAALVRRGKFREASQALTTLRWLRGPPPGAGIW